MGNGHGRSQIVFPFPSIPKETKLVLASTGLYGSFLYWGYLQEKITTPDAYYDSDYGPGTFRFPVFMNVMMTFSAMTIAAFCVALTPQKVQPDVFVFFKAAFSSSIASPIGFASLQFINYPLLILAKSCKLVPVMLMGVLIGGKRYKAKDYITVAFISVGVALFSMKPHKVQESSEDKGFDFKTLIGLGFVAVNLLLSGFTSASQDQICERYPITPFYMMKMINFWSVALMATYLILSYPVFGTNSELYEAFVFCARYPQVIFDILRYGFCGGVGQIFVFYIIKEFGSLVNTTVTVTRKFFSILISVIVFGHEVNLMQWFGIGFVFAGLSVNIVAKSRSKKKPKEGKTNAAPCGCEEPMALKQA